MEVKKIEKNVYEVAAVGKMNVPVKIFASEKLLKDIEKDRCLEQAKNVAELGGIIKNSIVLPDAHQGYGFCIGGVAAFDLDKGVISPGGVGYDINCSVRLLKTNLKKEDIEGRNKEISHSLFRTIPTGAGKGGLIDISKEDLKDIFVKGAKWAIEKGYGVESDWKHTEEEGQMKDAVVEYVSSKAISRGLNQLGSLGSGNHFVEVQYVDELFDKKTAKAFGLEKNQVCIMIHCGSRGLGHQVASDYIKTKNNSFILLSSKKEIN